MKKNRLSYLLLLSLLFLLGNCGKSSQNDKESMKVVESQESIEEERKFELPSVPIAIITPEERTDYLVKNYWENFDFSDSLWLDSPITIEQAMSNYLGLLSYAKPATVNVSIENLLRGASMDDNMFKYFEVLFEKYLYDPNSPMRNEEYYIQVLNYLVNAEHVEPFEKDRANYRLELLMKNRLGEKAANITYTLFNGETGTLYGIKSPYTILMFYNPDCHSCEEIISFLKASPVINGLLQTNTIALLAYYPDEDLSVWEKHLHDIPGNWINGYDKGQQVEKKKVYDLRAIPTLYLLDENKHVILKDASAEMIENYLWRSQSTAQER